MLKKFVIELEKRPPVETLVSRFNQLFAPGPNNYPIFTEQAFADLVSFLDNGEASFQGVAVQAGVRWSGSSQKVILRNAILRRSFITPSCLWAFKQLRGGTDEIFKDYPSPDMGFMQILLLKEADPHRAVPFLIERFLNRKEVAEELRAASRLCVLRLLDSGATLDLVRTLKKRYPGVEIINQWRPAIPGRRLDLNRFSNQGSTDFYQIVRSVHDIKELSSLSRIVYLTSLFYVPLTEKEWHSLLLSRTDEAFFQRLTLARMVEASNGGYLLTPDNAKQNVARKFLYESYNLAKESINRNHAERLKEDRERRVRNSELDRQALEMVPDGIICVDGAGLFYYMNPAAESILNENRHLRERLFGSGPIEEALKRYSRERVLSRITASTRDGDDCIEVFGHRVSIASGQKKFEVELGPQVILLRDTTNRYLIDQEIGRLYRHELRAALDVMGAGLDTARQLVKEGQVDEGLEFMSQVEQKRMDLFSMLEERMDFIRLHSDAFQIRPSTVNLNLVVDRCVGNYRDAAAAKGVVLQSNHLHVDAVLVWGEESFLIRAIDNLVRNAVKFLKNGDKVKVSVGSEDQQAFVRVADTGPGIPVENLGKVFQLGFTTGGTGRGLYLARRIASAHGGRIEVRSKPGEGADFTLRLPLQTEA